MKQTICDICGKPILESELNTKYPGARNAFGVRHLIPYGKRWMSIRIVWKSLWSL